MHLLRAYDYLRQTRPRLIEPAARLTAAEYARPFRFGVGSVGATLTHLLTAEWYYVERFQQHDVPPYAQWPIQEERPLAPADLAAHWAAQGDRVRALFASEQNWARPITYDSFPDAQARRFRTVATAADVVTQIVLHEVHHRAQLMAMLRELSLDAPAGDSRRLVVEDIDFAYLMFERTPLPPA